MRWIAPAGLLALSVVPLVAGALRLTELAAGAPVTADNARFFAMPVPVLLHIPASLAFCVLGTFQFQARFRAGRPGWHRAAGRVLVACGLVAALSGLWLTLFSDLPAGDGTLLAAFRLLFGTGMAVCLLLGLAAIRRRDVARHRTWMTRGYAIGLGAGTQAFTLAFGAAAFGPPGELGRALLVGAGWVINLAVAEWAVHRARRGRGGRGGRRGQVRTRSVS
ncbi:DUF2306 domain-containing protein [Nonomuraea sp. NPDC049637]|uniref:DUF2306 domain-containing protein n=1 Tax=Nonomuraea sp. NPDC049637 TaxID=3154356 RepID=UPI003414F4CC